MTGEAEHTVRGIVIVLLLYVLNNREDKLRIATGGADLLISYLVAMTGGRQ